MPVFKELAQKETDSFIQDANICYYRDYRHRKYASQKVSNIE